MLEYFKKNGHKVISFVPEYLLNPAQIKEKKKLNAMHMTQKKLA